MRPTHRLWRYLLVDKEGWLNLLVLITLLSENGINWINKCSKVVAIVRF